MAAARVSFTELGKLLAATPLPLYAVDAERIVRFANPALLAVLQVTGDDLIGKPTAFTSQGATRSERILTALCPDPKSLAGAACSGTVIFETAEQQLSCQIEWLPLPQNDAGTVAVLGIVRVPSELTAALAAGNFDESTSWNGIDESAKPITWHARLAAYRAAARAPYRLEQLVGESPAIRVAQGQAKLAAATRVPVCLVGPSGGGRSTLALAIHYAADAPSALVTLDCRSLTTELLAARLQGLGKQNAGGTLILRCLEDLPREVVSLIAILCRPESAWRILATADRAPADLAAAAVIDADLAARLSVLAITLPPLADRREDLPWLAQAIVEQHNARGGKQLRGCSSSALERLTAHDWPGETAELAQVLRAARDAARGTEIAPGDLPGYLTLAEERHRRAAAAPEAIDLPAWLAETERELLRRALAHARGNKTAAAKLVGMNRPRFYRRLVELGLEAESAELASTADDALESAQQQAANAEREAARAARRAKRIAARRQSPPPLSSQGDSFEPEFVEDIPFLPEEE